MPDEADETEPEILKRPDGSIQLAGGVSIDEVNELFGVGFPTSEAVTMAGLVHRRGEHLIGTSVWELKLGGGIIKGFGFGTLTVRAGVDWASGENVFGIGEYAVEYLRRLSPHFRVFFMFEGSEDEVSAVPEVQWHISRNVFVKANAGFGVTSKATDFAPEVGVIIALP